MNNCRGCLFDDVCDGEGRCEHYAKAEYTDDDLTYIGEVIRKDVEEEWERYVSEYE